MKANIDLEYLYDIYCDEYGYKPAKSEFADMIIDFVEDAIRAKEI